MRHGSGDGGVLLWGERRRGLELLRERHAGLLRHWQRELLRWCLVSLHLPNGSVILLRNGRADLLLCDRDRGVLLQRRVLWRRL